MHENPLLSNCPVCGAQVTMPGDVVKGELLACDDCDTELEVVALGPVELQETPEAGEEDDWGSLDA